MDPPILKPGTPMLTGLHGLGTNAEDFMGLVEALEMQEARFVLPDAPLQLPGYPSGAFAWYDFETHERSGLMKSRDHLFRVFDRFLDDPNVRRLDSSPKQTPPLVVFGFSQGGVMALEAGLNYSGPIAAIVSMSGYMPDPSETMRSVQLPKQTPILLVHGIYDPVVPVEGSRQAVEELRKAGYKPEFLEFPMEHSVTQDSLDAVRVFLEKVTRP
jgi:phospholipase/carboxylesterase